MQLLYSLMALKDRAKIDAAKLKNEIRLRQQDHSI